jgi:hypothetical protein
MSKTLTRTATAAAFAILALLAMAPVAAADETVTVEGQTYHCADRTPAQEVPILPPPENPDLPPEPDPVQQAICPQGQVPEPQDPSGPPPAPPPAAAEEGATAQGAIQQFGSNYFYANRRRSVSGEQVTALEGWLTHQDADVEGALTHSIAQLWALRIDGFNFDSIEFGWTDDGLPGTNSATVDEKPELFVYRFRNSQPCSETCGFTQISNTAGYVPGYPLSDSASLFARGPAHLYQIYEEGTSGKWWIALDGKALGYFGAGTWSPPLIYLSRVEAGGEVASTIDNEKPGTTMGSGSYASSGQSAYWAGIQDRTSNGVSRYVDFQTTFENAPDAYTTAGPAGSNFSFGGPGWCNQGAPGYCPLSVETGSAIASISTEASLNGNVYPGGKTVKAWFEYDPHPNAKSYAYQSAHLSVGSGSQVPISQAVKSLQPGTTYSYRIVAESSFGNYRYGAQKFFTTPDYRPTVTTDVADGAAPHTIRLNGTVNPNGYETSYHFELWGALEGDAKNFHLVPASEVNLGAGTSALSVSQTVTNLKPSTEYLYQLLAKNVNGGTAGVQRKFTTPADWRPVVATKDATGLGPAKATLNATVNPSGLATEYKFEYDTKEYKTGEGSHGTSIPSGSGVGIGAGSTNVDVGQTAANLKPGTSYHFRVVASNAQGTAYGDDKVLTTLPAAITDPASGVDGSHVTLHGRVNPIGLATTYRFEYDTAPYGKGEAPHGASAPAQPAAAGSGADYVALAQPLSGLQAGKVYHYRIVASNAEGTFYGEDGAFATWTAWTLESPPNPEAEDQSQLYDVSCTSSTACLAVGYDEYQGQGLAETWNGEKWSRREGAFDSKSTAVSCDLTGSTTYCMTIGETTAGLPYAQRWKTSGSLWLSYSTTMPAVPEGGSEVTLKAVSCSVEWSCTAVGSYKKEGKTRTLAERYDGVANTWSIQTTATTAGGSALLDVSCPAAGECVAVGYEPNGWAYKALTERWKESSWSVVSMQTTEGSVTSTARKVACPSTSVCIVTGSSAGGSSGPFTTKLSGTSWTSAGAAPTEYADISCASASACVAVGSEAGKTHIQSWSGSSWSNQTSPNPAGKSASLTGVSCAPALA